MQAIPDQKFCCGFYSFYSFYSFCPAIGADLGVRCRQRALRV